MTIAVHISFTESDQDPSKNFNYRCFSILAAKYPEHHFIFIFDKTFSPSLIDQKNITPVLLSPQIKNRLLAHYWYNFKIPAILNKYNTDFFISNGIMCSMRTKVKQDMVIQDLSFLEKENLFTQAERRYLKKYIKRFIAQAFCIATTNGYSAKSLAEVFPEAKNKIHVIGYGTNEITNTYDYDEIQVIKEKITEGKEYFLCYINSISEPNIIVLLKAFSAFKKRQLSNMQLVLVFPSVQKENPVKDLASYRYRNEVKIITPGTGESIERVMAAAYAAIYLPVMDIMEDFGSVVLKNNIPLITTDSDFNKSIYNNAVLYSKADEKNIAEKMMLIYKDENLRNGLVKAGNTLAATFSWDNTAARLWQALTGHAE